MNDANFDPSYTEKRIWRGPSWVNTNYYIVRGLLKQIERLENGELGSDVHNLLERMVRLAYKIASDSVKLVKQSGFREFYHPKTGEGYRVKNFGWSTLVVFLNRTADELLGKYEFLPRKQVTV